MNKEEFMENLKTLSKADLEKYRGAARLLNSCINAVGVAITLLLMYNPTILMILTGTPLICFLAVTGANIKDFLVEIKNQLLIRDK